MGCSLLQIFTEESLPPCHDQNACEVAQLITNLPSPRIGSVGQGVVRAPYTNTIVYRIHNPQVHKLQRETNIIIIHTCNDEQQALRPYNFLTLIVIDKMAIIWRIFFVKNTFYRQHLFGENW